MPQADDEALNETSTQEVTESPAVEEQPSQDVQEQPTEDATESQDETEQQEQPEGDDNQNSEDAKPKKNAQSRIRELSGKLKATASERDELQQLLENSKNIQVPDEISREDYQAMSFNNSLVARELEAMKRERAYEKVESAMDTVASTVPELNPDSDQYNADLEEAIAETYDEAFVLRDQQGNFAGVRKDFKEFALKQVEAYRKAETKGHTKSQDIINRQRAESPVTNNQTTASPKSNTDKSIGELEKELGVVRY